MSRAHRGPSTACARSSRCERLSCRPAPTWRALQAMKPMRSEAPFRWRVSTSFAASPRHRSCRWPSMGHRHATSPPHPVFVLRALQGLRRQAGRRLARRRIGASRAPWRATTVPGARCLPAEAESSSHARGVRPSRPDSADMRRRTELLPALAPATTFASQQTSRAQDPATRNAPTNDILAHARQRVPAPQAIPAPR